ncbi:MAG: hypothetical protein FJ214_04515 [Ignavibacteria bacterium]|nr:hypothetical protein [Ignavibacteria bacterium]
MGKAIIIYILGTLSIFLILNNNVNEKITSTTDSVSVNYSSIHVRNIANSVVDMLFAQLGDNSKYRISNWTSLNMFEGNAKYRIVDTLVSSDSLIKISIQAKYFNEIKNVDVLGKVAVVGSPGFVPPSVKAAISTNNNVVTAGNLIIDGRNHDLNGNIISNDGTLAVWTTQSFTH